MTDITEAKRIAPATIPPETVEEAARAMCETGNGPCKCLPDECGSIYWKAHALAALRAGIAAWPGMWVHPYTKHTTLPTENTNAEG